MSKEGWYQTPFEFDSYMTVEGLARNAWSGERIGGAYVTFEPLSGEPLKWGDYKDHNGWPNYASWKTLWKTDAQGILPAMSTAAGEVG
jgi:hypothetical protein